MKVSALALVLFFTITSVQANQLREDLQEESLTSQTQPIEGRVLPPISKRILENALHDFQTYYKVKLDALEKKFELKLQKLENCRRLKRCMKKELTKNRDFLCDCPAGEIGPPGPQGPKGDTGYAGLDGMKGQKGESGMVGNPGEPGLPGLNSMSGEPGIGLKGDKGEPGDQGFPGINGHPGEKGGRGIRGPIGEKGERGLPGPMGLSGLIGSKSESG